MELIQNLLFPISENVQNNGPIYLHFLLTKHEHSLDPNTRESYSPQYTFSNSKPLNKYKKQFIKKNNLLTGNIAQDEGYQKKADDKVVELLSYWYSHMAVNLLDDQSSWIKGSMPPPLDKYNYINIINGSSI
jgi:hypothetical protein